MAHFKALMRFDGEPIVPPAIFETKEQAEKFIEDFKVQSADLIATTVFLGKTVTFPITETDEEVNVWFDENGRPRMLGSGGELL